MRGEIKMKFEITNLDMFLLLILFSEAAVLIGKLLQY